MTTPGSPRPRAMSAATALSALGSTRGRMQRSSAKCGRHQCRRTLIVRHLRPSACLGAGTRSEAPNHKGPPALVTSLPPSTFPERPVEVCCSGTAPACTPEPTARPSPAASESLLARLSLDAKKAKALATLVLGFRRSVAQDCSTRTGD